MTDRRLVMLALIFVLPPHSVARSSDAAFITVTPAISIAGAPPHHAPVLTRACFDLALSPSLTRWHSVH